MSREFVSLSGEEKTVLWKRLNEIIKNHELQDALTVAFSGAMVGNLAKGEYQFQGGFGVSGNMKLSETAKKDAVEAELKDAAGDVNCEVKIACKLQVGDKIPEIANITPLKLVDGKMETSDKTTLVCKEGEVVLLDLWATWCPPCQGPMKHNVDMLKKDKESWKGKVRLIGLSIDQDVNALKTKIIEKDYQHGVEHYHAANGECTINAQLGSGGVPHVALINPEGIIVFKGHPMSLELEKAIDDLCEKGSSDLIPAAPAAGGGGKKQQPIPNKEMIGQEGMDIVNKFETTVKEMCNNLELKEACQGMQRAFFVMEIQSRYIEDKDQIGMGLTIHTLAMGPSSCEAGSKMVESMTQELRNTEGITCQTQIKTM